MPRRRVARGVLLGFLAGMSDYLLFRLLDVRMWLDGREVTLWVIVFFAANFALMGGLIEWLRAQRDRVSAQTEVIAAQQRSLLKQHEALLQERSLALVGRLASGVAHEVRNPLAVIRSSASLLGEGAEQGSREEDLSTFICEEVDRLDRFVGRLMTYTRRLEVEPSRVALLPLMERVSRLLQSHPRRDAPVVLRLSCPGEALAIEADEELFERLLLNVAHNALDLAEGEVELRVVLEEGEPVRIEVSDDGPGVDEAHAEEIFEPFYTTRPEGTGLGLAMARKISELHHFSLSYRADRGLGEGGRGACLSVRLAPGQEVT